MIATIFNLASTILSGVRPMKITQGQENTELKCRIVEISEQQNYDLPSFPIDSGEYRTDTIYRLPKILNVRVFVKGDEIDAFLNAVNKIQFSNELFTISSLHSQTYRDYKLISYARDTNATMTTATHYNLQFQEVILVGALAQSYKSQSNAGYSSSKQMGNKAPSIAKKSALLEGSNALGFF